MKLAFGFVSLSRIFLASLQFTAYLICHRALSPIEPIASEGAFVKCRCIFAAKNGVKCEKSYDFRNFWLKLGSKSKNSCTKKCLNTKKFALKMFLVKKFVVQSMNIVNLLVFSVFHLTNALFWLILLCLLRYLLQKHAFGKNN